MNRQRTAVFTCAMGVSAILLVSGCDSRSGVDTASSPSTASTARPSAAASTAPTTGTPTSATAVATVPVGEVPTNPQAAEALRPWATDLVDGDIDLLTKTCWTISLQGVAEMYTDTDAILAAIAQPGVDGQFAVTWTGPQRTVSVKRSEIVSGYACPSVRPTGSSADLDPREARHTVRRYLSRFIGKPVNPADVEGDYRLVCDGALQTWDPDGTGTATAPPLANNPGRLTGITAFQDSEITSEQLGNSYVRVSVPVTNAAGVTTTEIFTLDVGANGYCIGDVSP
ncbi:hypothetical protein ACHIPZ_10325 [Antrihabitans sp. NCIMB 15449]|uniref:Uncharacterized protein n=1 Tax=Antrihabitans spumae TaxID=3373370 RepID=A0ABW7JNC7_9NOCA